MMLLELALPWAVDERAFPFSAAHRWRTCAWSAYSRCEVFFHVVYSHAQKPEAVLGAVRKIATQEAGSLTLQTPVLPPLGNQPDGFVVRYEDPSGRRVAIVFLVVDLLQHGQRLAIGAVAASPTASPASGATPPAPSAAPTPP